MFFVEIKLVSQLTFIILKILSENRLAAKEDRLETRHGLDSDTDLIVSES
jgi:hypothetical protein